MKKLSKYLLIIILSLFIIPIVSVNAAPLDVKTINASINDNKISVDGTVNNGVLAVAILVYEEDGTTLVTMATTSVDYNDKYSDTIDVTPGKKYIVKAANYDGIITWIVIVLVSVSGIVVTIVYRKKKNI